MPPPQQATPPTEGEPNALCEALSEAWELPTSTALPRRVGACAQLSALRAKARRLEVDGDTTAAADTYSELARVCWTSGMAYGEALRAAHQVLLLRPFDPIRHELAEWLERIGLHLASAILLEATPAGAATDSPAAHRRRLATLFHRAGDAAAACVHFAEVARLEPEVTDALSAIGTMAGWAPEQVSRERGVLAWHEAARRFKEGGALLAAFESIHRAFELDPASSLAAERLAHELSQLGRREAADEIWRQSAVAAGEPARHDVRTLVALDAGDIIAALAAMLDSRADATFDMSELLGGVEHLLSPNQGMTRGFDTVLAELGCADWLAVRLESGPLLERWTDEAGCHVALARLEAGYFVHLEAAREALVRAIVVHPGQPEARARLSSWAGSEVFPDVLLRALVQSARAAQGGLLARQLAGEIVEQHRGDIRTTSLRLWAFERLQQTGHLSESLRTEMPELLERSAQLASEVHRLQLICSTAPDAERTEVLKVLERLLAVDPTRSIDHLAVVVALVELSPNDLAAQSLYLELLDVAARLVISPSRDDRLATALALAPRLLGERGCIAQAKFYLRHGQIELALSALLQLLDAKAPSVRGLLWLLTLARRFRDALSSARALERIACAFRPAIRGVLEALAAELYWEAQAPEEASRLVAGALRTNQNMSRLVTLETRLSEFSDPGAGIEIIERALSKALPTAQLCRLLSKEYQHVGEFDVALAWAQRALSLRPGDLELRSEQLQLALEVGDAARVSDILRELMTHALPIFAWVGFAASALAWLTSVDAIRAMDIAQALLDHVGASDRSLRAALLEVAQVNGNEGFAIEVLERARAAAPESAPIHLALAERRRKNGQTEAGLLAALDAAIAGADPDTWRHFVSVSTDGISADAELTRLELARLLSKQDDTAGQAESLLRQLAVMRFDLAQDPDGAMEIWRELAGTDSADWRRVSRDIADVLGNRDAAARLQEQAGRVELNVERAKLLGLAAQLSCEVGDYGEAERSLGQALSVSTESTKLLPLAERVTAFGNEPERLESLYAHVETTVLGVFGERSLHYRAARAFEQIRAWPLALRHALLAFETLPDDEASWTTLLRVSRAAGEPQVLAHAAMHVAEATRNRERSRRLLERAYSHLGESADELRLKFDLAIRVLVGAPQVRGVKRVAECIGAMQRVGIEEVDFMETRFERALESLIGDLEGPDGARLGIGMCSVAATALGKFELSAKALLAAFKADGDLEEFAGLSESLAPLLVAGRDAYMPMIGRILDWLERPYVHAGEEALGLLARLAATLFDAVALGRVEQCAERTGRRGWFRQWTLETLVGSLFNGGVDGRLGAIGVSTMWCGANDAELSLASLDRAAVEFGAQNPSALALRALDATWHAFREQYERAMSSLPLPEELGALRHRLQRLEPFVPAEIVSLLRVHLERRSADPRALCSALAEQAFIGIGTPATRAELLIEAATIAQALGDAEGALVYFRTAVSTQRTSAAARLGLGTLILRMGRHHDLDQAQALLELTESLESAVAEDQREIVVFLRAEGLGALGKQAEAHQLLEEAESRIGPRPLIVLGLAEHAVRRKLPALALGYYAAALGGNLRQMRSHAVVALAAARAAAAAGDVSTALHWLAPSLGDAATRPDALVLEAELQGAADALTEEPAIDDERVAFAQVPSVESKEPPAMDGTPEATGTEADATAAQLIEPPLPVEHQVETLPLPEEPDVAAAQRFEPTDPVTVQEPTPTDDLGPNQTAELLPEIDVTASVGVVEPSAVELAIAVAERVAQNPEQLQLWLVDGKRWLRQWPLSARLAEFVQRAAQLEGHSRHAVALEQVIGVLRGDTSLVKPDELGEQLVDVDAVRSLLLRDLATPESEALALLWDGAEHEFLREASDYEVTGVMRVIGTASPLARTYSEVSRHFGVPKTPLFYKRSPQALVTRVLLLNPTAAMLEGELSTDESLVGYRVGCALWATIAEHSLLFGLGTERAIAVLRALVLAFGATGGQPNPTLGESLRLAQVLWQTVKSRSQRRLKEICISELDFERVRVTANQSLRRAGLYASGDLGIALREVVSELGVSATSNSWSDLCRTAPELMDLFRFAASAEYADVRWQSGRPTQAGSGAWAL